MLELQLEEYKEKEAAWTVERLGFRTEIQEIRVEAREQRAQLIGERAQALEDKKRTENAYNFIKNKREVEKEILVKQTRFLTDKEHEYEDMKADYKAMAMKCKRYEALWQRHCKEQGIDSAVVVDDAKLGDSSKGQLFDAKLEIQELSAEVRRLEKELDIAYWTSDEPVHSSCGEIHQELKALLDNFGKVSI